MKVNKASSADFIARGGQIPAPVHSFKTKRMINALPIGKAFSDGLAG